jgi:hypothetical protein
VLDDYHLHPSKKDPISEWLAKSLRTLQKCAVQLHENEIGLFDELKSAKGFAQELTDNRVTVFFLTRGKKTITLGKYAKPGFSKLITRSRDI